MGTSLLSFSIMQNCASHVTWISELRDLYYIHTSLVLSSESRQCSSSARSKYCQLHHRKQTACSPKAMRKTMQVQHRQGTLPFSTNFLADGLALKVKNKRSEEDGLSWALRRSLLSPRCLHVPKNNRSSRSAHFAY